MTLMGSSRSLAASTTFAFAQWLLDNPAGGRASIPRFRLGDATRPANPRARTKIEIRDDMYGIILMSAVASECYMGSDEMPWNGLSFVNVSFIC